MNKLLRIFLADDHELMREGLKMLIKEQADMEIIGEASGGRAAWQQIKKLQPDIVVMDVSMPDMNGAQVTKRLTQECPHIKIIALTGHEDQTYLRQLLQAGASGYVLKRVAAKELIHAIHVVAAGGVYIDPSLAGRVVGGYIGRQANPGVNPVGELSERETEVLRLIAFGYSNKEIAAQLDISVKTIETYKTRLMDKLELHSRADIVRYAIQHGWLQNS
ncbi:MAG: response regulator transcription factor [Pyrinomonadaceae bacterium]